MDSKRDGQGDSRLKTLSSQKEHDTEKDPRILDFTSCKFNPSAVLSSENRTKVKIPCPNAKTFNNIAEYSNKTFGRKASNNNNVTTAPIERKFTAEQIAATIKPERKKKDISTVLSRMMCSMTVEDDVEQKEKKPEVTEAVQRERSSCGPIHVLHEAKGKRVRMMIRRRKFGPIDSQFAWMTGLLIAFDKHHNLILHDVDEFVSKKSSVMTTPVQDEKDHKERRRRHIKRIFLRGDSIQIISIDSK